ncbi:hypothetical protein H8K12_08320, partial [Clostridium perfringens]|nr:hypothetical protein [Clostridium perfringens]
ERTQKPTLILAHNKTLAAQLCAEFKEFFPDNIVEELIYQLFIVNGFLIELKKDMF